MQPVVQPTPELTNTSSIRVSYDSGRPSTNIQRVIHRGGFTVLGPSSIVVHNEHAPFEMVEDRLAHTSPMLQFIRWRYPDMVYAVDFSYEPAHIIILDCTTDRNRLPSPFRLGGVPAYHSFGHHWLRHRFTTLINWNVCVQLLSENEQKIVGCVDDPEVQYVYWPPREEDEDLIQQFNDYRRAHIGLRRAQTVSPNPSYFQLPKETLEDVAQRNLLMVQNGWSMDETRQELNSVPGFHVEYDCDNNEVMVLDESEDDVTEDYENENDESDDITMY